MQTTISDQTKKDRKTLLRGAALAVGGVGALALLAHKSRGGVIGRGEWIPKVKPADPLKGVAGARANAVRKYAVEETSARGLKADNLRQKRAWGALPTEKKGWGKRLAKQKPEVQVQAADLYQRGAKGAAVEVPPNVKAALAHLTPGESGPDVMGRYARDQRQRARQDLLALRQKKNFSSLTGLTGLTSLTGPTCPTSLTGPTCPIFSTPASGMIQFEKRDGWDHAKDGAVAGGALASGGAAVYGAREWGKTNKAIRKAAENAGKTIKQVGETLNPKEVARAGVHEVGRAATATAREYFPTFAKGIKALKKHVFRTPAGGMVHFAGAQQLKDPDSKSYASPLRVAAGMQRGYYDTDKGGSPIVKDVPILHGQVIRAGMNKAKQINQVAVRGGSMVRDVADTAMGKERRKDAAGRTKKKEWEKSWFKKKAGEVATAGAVLAGTAYLAKNPSARAAVQKADHWVAKQARRVVPDAFPDNRVFMGVKAESGNAEMLKEFSTPAAGMFGNLRGASKDAKALVASREALLGRVQSKARMGDVKAAGTAKAVKRNLAGKKAAVKLAERRQGDAIRTLKKGALIAGGGALAGGAVMKAYADQPEKAKVSQGSRFRNALVGAAAGSFLGGGLHAGGSGFHGARVGAVLGGLTGALSNPKRKASIDNLTSASFATPAGRLLCFDDSGSQANQQAKKGDWKNAAVNTMTSDATGMAVDGSVIGGSALAASMARRGKLKGVVGKAAIGAENWLTKHPRLNPLAVGAVGTALTIPVIAGLMRHQRQGVKAESRNAEMLKGFRTPAAGLLHFDVMADEAGWDVRDPRGRSARVFAPGSRKRVRREKDWIEEVGNERKVWKGALVAGALAAGVGGVMAGRHFPIAQKLVKDAAAHAEKKIVAGPWQKSG